RMKGINYLASVVKTYRNAIDAYVDDPATYTTNPKWVAELFQVFHREYSTGFYFNKSDEQLPNYNNIHHGKIHSFIGKIIDRTDDHTYRVGIRNKLCIEDTIEVLSPVGRPTRTQINQLLDMDQTPILCAQPNSTVLIKLNMNCHPHDIIRKI
ncbi:MAG: U32 family peptidase C-terminal domain-containing protein, partial [Desulfobacula sp.]|nr:U32 family peptidase C-terminal domain-containing protein [Desulfobacula sp.]